MSAEDEGKPMDPEAEGALAALRRARIEAERVAFVTGTFLVQVVNGETVLVPPRAEVLSMNKARERAS